MKEKTIVLFFESNLGLKDIENAFVKNEEGKSVDGRERRCVDERRIDEKRNGILATRFTIMRAKISVAI